MAGERPVALSIKSMGGPRVSFGGSAGTETGFRVRTTSHIARPDISLPSPLGARSSTSERFSPKPPIGAQRITPLSVDNSEIRTPAPRTLGAYVPTELFHSPTDTVTPQPSALSRTDAFISNVGATSSENGGLPRAVSPDHMRTLRDQSPEQALQLLQRRLQVPAQSDSAAREPQIFWNYRSGRRENPAAPEPQRQVLAEEMQRSPVLKQEISAQPPEAKSNVIAFERKRAIRNELAQIAEGQVPKEVTIQERTAEVVRVVPLTLINDPHAAVVDNPPAEQSSDPSLKQKPRKNPQDAGWYLFERRLLERRRAEIKKKEFQLSQPYESTTTTQMQQNIASTERTAATVKIAAQSLPTGQPSVPESVGASVSSILEAPSARERQSIQDAVGVNELLGSAQKREELFSPTPKLDVQTDMKKTVLITTAQPQVVEQTVGNLQPKAIVSHMAGPSASETVDSQVVKTAAPITKEENGRTTLLQQLMALGINIIEGAKKIYFKVDKPTQEVRRRDSLAAIEAYADTNGRVEGANVASAIGIESKGNWVSALLRKFGYEGSDHLVDGSAVAVKNEIANAGLQKKRDMKKIVIAVIEDTPAVDANEIPDGILVGEREVETVVRNTSKVNLPIAA